MSDIFNQLQSYSNSLQEPIQQQPEASQQTFQDSTQLSHAMQNKSDRLKARVQQKIQALDSSTSTGISNAYLDNLIKSSGDDGQSSDYIDEAQASLYRAGRDLGHMGTDILSWGAEKIQGSHDPITQGLDSIKWSSDEDVNKAVGYDPTYANNLDRNMSKSYDNMMNNPSLSNLWNLTRDTVKTVPHMATDMTDIAVTMPFGGEGLWVKIAGGLNKLAKADRAAVALDRVATLNDVNRFKGALKEVPESKGLWNLDTVPSKAASQDLKLFRPEPTMTKESVRTETKKVIAQSNELKKKGILNAESNEALANTLTKLDSYVKVNKATVLLGSSSNANDMREFKKNNNGESASPLRVLANEVAQVGLFGANFSLFNKALGRDKGVAEKVKNIFTGTKDIVEDALNRGKTSIVGHMILDSAAEIAKVSGPAAAQMWTMTWSSILAQKAGSSKYGSVENVILDKENQKKANMSALSGAAFAGASKVVPLTFTTPLKGAAILATKGVQSGFNKIRENGKSLDFLKLSDEDRRTIAAKYDLEKKVSDEVVAEHDKHIEDINNANTIDDLKKLNNPAIDASINDLIDSKFGSKTIMKQISNAKTIDDIKKVSKTTSDYVDTYMKDKPDTEITPEILSDIKNGAMSHIREAHISMDSKSKLNNPILDSVDSARTLEDIGKIDNNEVRGRLDKFKSELQDKANKESESGSNDKPIVDKQIEPTTKEFDTFKKDLIDNLDVNRDSLSSHLDKNIDKIKNESIAQHNEAILQVKTALEARRAADVGYKFYDKAKQGVGYIGKKLKDQLSPETIKTIANVANDTKDITSAVINGSIDVVKGADHSAARAMLDDVSKGKLNNKLYGFSHKQLDHLAEGFKDNKKAQDVISLVKKNKDKAKNAFGIGEDKGDGSIIDYISSSAKTLSETPLAFKIRGLFSLGFDNLYDSKFVKKANDVIKSMGDEAKIKEELTPEQYEHYQTVKTKIEDAEKELNAAETKSANDEKKSNSDYVEPERKLFSDNTMSVLKELSKDDISEYKLQDNLTPEDFFHLFRATTNAKLLKEHGFKDNEISNITKPISRKLINDSIVEHKKNDSSFQNKFVDESGKFETARIEDDKKREQNRETVKATNKGTAIENLDTISIKKEELEKAKDEMKKFAEKVGIELC